MYEDDIKKVDEWFANHAESFGTYHTENEYLICESDLEAFADFLREEFPDLVYIRCFFGKDDSVIWFFRDDLEEARFY